MVTLTTKLFKILTGEQCVRLMHSLQLPVKETFFALLSYLYPVYKPLSVRNIGTLNVHELF